MELMHAIYSRRAVREYTPAPVDDVAIRKLLHAAVHAPSAVNEQPWRFVVVRDQAKLDRISANAKRHLMATMAQDPRAPHFMPMLEDAGYQIFYHAPALLLICAYEPIAWAVEDCTLAAQNLMLAAHGAGLGSCWIGFAQHYLNTPEGKHILDLPESWLAVAPIIVGHPRQVPAATPRNEPIIDWINGT
ncbi:MAG TPA: nitroreductase [Burkholderiaceae bacterium]